MYDIRKLAICYEHSIATGAYSGGIVRRPEQGAESQGHIFDEAVDNLGIA